MTERINAIDAARGICLINIFVIHITFGVLREASPSKIAFCDSAEIFVLLAGVSAFLVTGGRDSAHDAGAARTRMWRRAGTLYGANLAIIAASWLILLAAAPGMGAPNPTLAPPELIGCIGWSYWCCGCTSSCCWSPPSICGLPRRGSGIRSRSPGRSGW